MTDTVLVSIASVCVVVILGVMIHAGDWSTLNVLSAAGMVLALGWAWQRATHK
jgi:hypothetical protein